MKLWILRPKDRNKLSLPWYDKTFGFVVRAENQAAARLLASEYPGDEGTEAWLDPRNSTCEELAAKGNPEVVMKDFAAA
jgi:hypothetical protein